MLVAGLAAIPLAAWRSLKLGQIGFGRSISVRGADVLSIDAISIGVVEYRNLGTGTVILLHRLAFVTALSATGCMQAVTNAKGSKTCLH